MRKSRLFLCISLGSAKRDAGPGLTNRLELAFCVPISKQKITAFNGQVGKVVEKAKLLYIPKKQGCHKIILCFEITLTFSARERLASSFSIFPAAVATSFLALLDSTLK